MRAASEGLALPRIQARVLRQQALGTIRAAILANDIAPGTRLLEAEMASRMGVSRAPVREALRQLEQEGLVDFSPHRGARVIGVPAGEIDALYELRAVIEAKAIARASSRMTEQGFASLRASMAGMNHALARGNMAEVARHDMEFHRQIVELSGFALLKQLWSSVDGLVRSRSYQAMAGKDRAARSAVRSLTASHEQLVEALRKGNPKRAGDLIRKHILDVPARRAPASRRSARSLR